MSISIATRFFWLWFLLSLNPIAYSQTGETLAVLGGHVFDTESGEFRVNQGVLIEDGIFKQVNASLNLPDNTPVLELTDSQYILPGLIDCHAHYNVKLFRNRREEFDVIPIQYLANGVTVTFSCGEYLPEQMLQLRKDIESGVKIGPRLLNSGPYFGIVRRPWHADPQQVREEVDFWAAKGVGGLKAKLIDPACLEALIDQAHQHGLTVTGHLDSGFRNSVNPSTAIDMGIDRVEHFLGGDAMPADKSAYASLPRISADMPEFKAIVKKYIDHGVYFDATISAYGYFGNREKFYDYWFEEPSLFTTYVQEKLAERRAKRPYRPTARFQKIFEAKQKTIDDFFRAGGLITLGTDHFSDGTFLAGFGAHREMEIMCESGIPNADVLKIATISGARALKIDNQHGSIEAGKAGDLLIIEGNPLDQIRNTRNVLHVIKAGQTYNPKALLESCRGKLGPNNDQEAEEW